jgi:hypothetical protein
MKYLIISVLLALSVLSYGQNNFNGILLSRQDSTAVQFAFIKLKDMGSFVQTNAAGEFHFQIPASLKVLHFEISAIGLHDTIVFHRTRNAVEKLYVNKQPLALSQVNIKGLTAAETVKQAVDMIPANYLDSSFAAFSFFRQYQKVNGVFKNLAEAQTVILFKLAAARNGIAVSNGFDVEQMRRSNFKYDIEDFYYEQNSIADLLNQDPVYNLMPGALNPNAYNFYTFKFDTTNKTDDFVITYSCKEFTSDDHGVSNIRELGWNGEGREEGKFTIDRRTFAFKKIERTSYRNPEFNYPRNNNWLIPSRTYYCEFADGKMLTEYEQRNGKWFLKKICQAYTNDYYLGETAKKMFTITDTYEWYSDSITHYIATELTDKFYRTTELPSCLYTYNKDQWNKPWPAFQYFTKEEVYRDLEKPGVMEEQFESSGKQQMTPPNLK